MAGVVSVLPNTAGVVTVTPTAQVNKDEICAVGEGLEKASVTYIKRDEVLGTMKQNMLIAPSLKWQYYATEDGVLFSYPTLNYCNDRYDPRFRLAFSYFFYKKCAVAYLGYIRITSMKLGDNLK